MHRILSRLARTLAGHVAGFRWAIESWFTIAVFVSIGLALPALAIAAFEVPTRVAVVVVLLLLPLLLGHSKEGD